jgi:hypothetical protein
LEKQEQKSSTMINKRYKEYDEEQLEEDLADVRYEKQYTKFLVRNHKLEKRRANDWDLYD